MVNDNLYVRGAGAETIAGLTLTVDPSGAATYDLANFNAAQTFDMTTNGTNLTIGDVSNSGAVPISITSDSGDVNVTNFDTANATLSLTSAGNILIAPAGMNAGNGTITLAAGGYIRESGGDATTTNITTSGTLNLTAGTGIGQSGASQELDTSIGTLVASSGTGGIYIEELSGLTIGRVQTTASGDINIGATAGAIGTSDTITTAGGGGITITAGAGSVQLSNAVNGRHDWSCEYNGYGR